MSFREFVLSASGAMHVYALPTSLLVLVVLCSPGSSVLGQEWEDPTEESQKLTASDASAESFFGLSTSISGEWLVVGAPGDDDNGTLAGAVYAFRFDADAGEWVEEAKLTTFDEEEQIHFGWSVGISGERLIAGTWDWSTGAAGSAYVFRFDGDWVEEDELVGIDTEEGDQFGWSVSISGERAVAGAKHDDDDGTSSGSAYVFLFDPELEVWVEEEKLTASDGAAEDRFGSSVSISDDRVVVGSPFDDDNGFRAGSAYVFLFDPDTEEWVEEQKLTADDGSEEDRFGSSVSISGEHVIVWGDGSAYVFLFDPELEEWVEQQKLSASDDSVLGAVSISGERWVAGAPRADGNGTDSGAAYLFHLECAEREWVEAQKLIASDGAENDFLGGGPSISGEWLVMGASSDDTNGTRSGSAYVFEIGEIFACDAAFLRGDADNSGEVSAIPDALYLLRWGFTKGPEPECDAAADVDGNGILNALTDPLYLLRWNFGGGDAPPDPGPDECGPDPDDAECEVPPDC